MEEQLTPVLRDSATQKPSLLKRGGVGLVHATECTREGVS